MHYYAFRTFLVLTLLVFLSMLAKASPLGAMSRSTGQEHSFQPSGHGFVTAQKVSTATTPQVRNTEQNAGQEMAIYHPAPNMHATVPAPQNVVSVPPATSSNTSAIEGLADDGTKKPDANGAGGTENYLETINSQLAIYSRSGTLQYTTSFQTWFGLASTIPVHDPVVVWDNTGSRFIFTVQTGASLFLSVAQQTDATGNFCNYKFPAPNNLGFDFDKLGVNGGGVYFSANLLDSSTGNLKSNELFFANRTQLETCTKSVSYTSWQGLTNPDGSLANAIVPAVRESGSGGTEYLVNSYPSGACQLTLWTLTSNPTLSNTSISTQCYSPPPLAKQKGSTYLIGSGDSSLTQASFINGLLTVALTGSYDWGDGNGSVGIVEWFVLNPLTASVSGQGAFGTPGLWLYYPAAVKNYAGHMLFVYNASGPTSYVSIWYVNQTLTGTKALQQGQSAYQPKGGAPWGDYNSAWLDMSGSNDNAVWITGEYAQTTSAWATKFGLVIP